MNIISLIMEKSGKTMPAIDPTHCTNEAILCTGNNDVDHIREDVL
jgi:hypothetical protein